ncbi:hypothetical protein ACWC5I_23465 [Kitasatospora sp. NPDC001574]
MTTPAPRRPRRRAGRRTNRPAPAHRPQPSPDRCRRVPHPGRHRPPKPSTPRTDHHGGTLTPHPLYPATGVKAVAAALHIVGDELTALGADQPDRILENLLRDGAPLPAAEPVVAPARTLVVPGPSPVHEAPERTAQPFVTIRHTGTGEITTTGYNEAALRILLRAGFEEVPGCACPAPETGTDGTHESSGKRAICSSPAAPCAWAEPTADR